MTTDHGYRIVVSVPDKRWAELSPYTQEVLKLMGEMAKILLDREPKYGDSWRQQGVDGLTHSVIEKLRRFWHQVMVKGEVPNPENTLDASNYLLFIQALANLDGEEAVSRMKTRGVKELFE